MSLKPGRFLQSKLLLGFVLPLTVEVVGALLICSTDSGANADGFAGIVVLLMLLIALPGTLLGNIVILAPPAAEPARWFRRGMILPVMFLSAVLIYYSGIWDRWIHPLFPRTQENIQTLSSRKVDETTFESFFVVREFSDDSESLTEIEQYATEDFESMIRANPDYLDRNLYFYFVTADAYQGLDDDAIRQRAIVAYRHLASDKTPALERIKPE